MADYRPIPLPAERATWREEFFRRWPASGGFAYKGDRRFGPWRWQIYRRPGARPGCSGPAVDDTAGIARALGDIARAKGMTQVAKDAGLSRESLYRALSADGNPSFATALKVARALGVKLHAQAA